MTQRIVGIEVTIHTFLEKSQSPVFSDCDCERDNSDPEVRYCPSCGEEVRQQESRYRTAHGIRLPGETLKDINEQSSMIGPSLRSDVFNAVVNHIRMDWDIPKVEIWDAGYANLLGVKLHSTEEGDMTCIDRDEIMEAFEHMEEAIKRLELEADPILFEYDAL